ncbi:MAG: EF-hand domain-containing protein, partial [Pontiella sp.]|nr:EF-hand domain-containing protein [Pontiella sp.]
MNTRVLKTIGLSMAVAGAMSIAAAEEESKGERAGRQGKGDRPTRGQFMERFDTDGDGVLSEAERAAAQEARESQGGRRGGPDGERPSRDEAMKRFDTDGDGQLSESEREAMRAEMETRRGGRSGGERPSREEMMKRFDTDGDGTLSDEERAAMR